MNFSEKASAAKQALDSARVAFEEAKATHESGPGGRLLDAIHNLDELYRQIDAAKALVSQASEQAHKELVDHNGSMDRVVSIAQKKLRDAQAKAEQYAEMQDAVERVVIERWLDADPTTNALNSARALLKTAHVTAVANDVLSAVVPELERAVAAGGYDVIRAALDAMPGAPNQSPEAVLERSVSHLYVNSSDVRSLREGGRIGPVLAQRLRSILSGDMRTARDTLMRDTDRYPNTTIEQAVLNVCRRIVEAGRPR